MGPLPLGELGSRPQGVSNVFGIFLRLLRAIAVKSPIKIWSRLGSQAFEMVTGPSGRTGSRCESF